MSSSLVGNIFKIPQKLFTRVYCYFQGFEFLLNIGSIDGTEQGRKLIFFTYFHKCQIHIFAPTNWRDLELKTYFLLFFNIFPLCRGYGSCGQHCGISQCQPHWLLLFTCKIIYQNQLPITKISIKSNINF